TSAPLTFTITVTPVNDPPVANDDMFTVSQGSTNNIFGVLTNDADIDGGPLTIQNVSDPPNGAAAATNGTISYTPDFGFNSMDTFTYQACDPAPLCDTATVTVTVTPNLPPNAVDDMATTLEDTLANISVLANDTDPENDPLSISGFTQGANGMVTDPGGGVLRYTPNANFNGMDSFTYTIGDGMGNMDTATVNVTVTAVNDPPSFTGGPDDAVVEDDIPRVVAGWASNISAGPPDEQATQTLMFVVTNNTNPALFSAAPAVDAAGGDLSYTTALNAFGSADITLALMDNGGTANGGSDSSAPFTFTITVFGVNDAPVAADDFPPALASTAGPTVLDVLANDTDVDGDPLTISAVGSPACGAVMNNSTSLTYTPTPSASDCAESFTYTASDGLGGMDTATVSFTVLGNAPPTAADDASATNEDAFVDINVLANDTDSDGPSPLSISGFTQGANGSVANQGGGVLRYTPSPNFNGMDSFTYDVTDGVSTDTATVNLTVTAVNDPPSFTGGPNQTVAEDSGAQSVPGWATNLSPGPANEAGQTLSFTVTGNTNAALFSAAPAVSPTGTLTFTPAANASGSADITVVLMDNGGTANGGSNSSPPFAFTITITPVNDPPVIVTLTSNPASPAPATSPSGASIAFSATATDVDGDTLTFAWSGDCGTSSAQAPTLTCPIGINTVNLTVDDGNSGADNDSIDVTITDYMVAAQCQGGTPPCNSATMATLSAGQAVNFDLTATGVNGTYNAGITFSCQGLPARTTCTFTPSNSIPNAPPGGSTITLRIQTTAPIVAQLGAPHEQRSSPPPIYALWMGVPGLALFGVVLAGRRRKHRTLGTLCLLAVVLVMGGMLAGCGGGGDVAPTFRPGTPTGSHSITVRAAGSGTLEHTVNLTVVVQ
ncbi:Ig-like domain-containing protein, partial [Actinokineospora sp.]|uniref:cadherin-like domain-containing protein n=1 Tax=Actinokineospora sp. TaxID=1872133 RepID=UPI003D6C15EC